MGLAFGLLHGNGRFSSVMVDVGGRRSPYRIDLGTEFSRRDLAAFGRRNGNGT